MTYLLHRDTCIGWMRGVQSVRDRVLRHPGDLYVSAATVLNLEYWLLRPATPSHWLRPYGVMLRQLVVVSVDEAVAHEAARLGSRLALQGMHFTLPKQMV